MWTSRASSGSSKRTRGGAILADVDPVPVIRQDPAVGRARHDPVIEAFHQRERGDERVATSFERQDRRPGRGLAGLGLLLRRLDQFEVRQVRRGVEADPEGGGRALDALDVPALGGLGVQAGVARRRDLDSQLAEDQRVTNPDREGRARGRAGDHAVLDWVFDLLDLHLAAGVPGLGRGNLGRRPPSVRLAGRPRQQGNRRTRPATNHDADRHVLTLVDQDVAGRDLDGGVGPLDQQGSLERDPPLGAGRRRDRQDRDHRSGQAREGLGPSAGDDPVERQRLGLALGLLAQRLDEARLDPLASDPLVGPAGVLDDGPDPLAEFGEPALDLGRGARARPPSERRDQPSLEDGERDQRDHTQADRADGPFQCEAMVGPGEQTEAGRSREGRRGHAEPDLVSAEQAPDLLESPEEFRLDGHAFPFASRGSGLGQAAVRLARNCSSIKIPINVSATHGQISSPRRRSSDVLEAAGAESSFLALALGRAIP